MKQAQAGQMIVYLLVIVIFGMILVFGYKAVVNIRQKTDTVDYLAFQKGLEADIDSIAFDYGSVKKVDYSIRGYTKVCFANLSASIKLAPSPPPKIVENSIEDGVKKNIFLVNGKVESFYIKKANIQSGGALDYNPLCVPVENGKLNVKLTGKGDFTLVEEQP